MIILKKNLISVIIPVYNGATTVLKTLECMEKQSYKNLEVIVINDGSTDDSEYLIQEYIKNASINIKLFSQNNLGLSEARNAGFLKSSGNRISFIDCDDLIPSDFYESMLKSDADIVVCDILYKYTDRKVISKQNIFNKEVVYKNEKIFANYCKLLNPMAPNKLIKREVLEKILFDKGVIFEDVLFFFKALVHIDSIGFSNTEYVYIISDESLSTTLDTRFDNTFTNWNLIVDYHKKNNTFSQYQEILYYSCNRYLKDIYMRKMKDVVNYKELKYRYLESKKFISDTFNTKYVMPMFNLKELYLKYISIINVYLLWVISNRRVILSNVKKNVLYKSFNKNKYYKQLESTNYKSFIASELDFSNEVQKPYFCKNYENYFYGIGNCFEQFDLNKVYIEHGYNFSSVVTSNSTALNADEIVCASKDRKEIFEKRYGKKTYAVGPYIQYAKNFYDIETMKEMKEKYGKVLLVFPSHSSLNYHSNYDEKAFISEIEKVRIEKSIDTVLVCLHYYDLKNNVNEMYADYTVVCAGHIHDVHNISKLKNIIELSDYTMSNEIGTHIAYCFSLNKPHLLVHDEVTYDGEYADMDSPRFKSYKKKEKMIIEDIFNSGFTRYEDNAEVIDKYFSIGEKYEI